MSNALFVSRILFSVIFAAHLIDLSHGDVGTATHYSPPYLPTACGGNDRSVFPGNNLFAAAGEGIWENGAACGRRYLVRCLSSTVSETCVPDQMIIVTIVDRAVTTVSKPAVPDVTMLMSTTAYNSIVQKNVGVVKIEFTEN